jgi:hypothetical protein
VAVFRGRRIEATNITSGDHGQESCVSKAQIFPRISATTLLLGTLVLVWFLSFAYRGIFADFSVDDLMNLDYYVHHSGSKAILASLEVFTFFYRPLGGLFYLSLYKAFGLHPLPFRLFCFALLLLNLILFYRFFRLLSGKPDIAWTALFLISYHAWFVDLYYSSGTIYELLCVFFYLLAFTAYVKIRSSGQWMRTKDWILIVVYYAAALDSKELAVTLPFFIGLYELIYFTPHSFRKIGAWILKEGRAALVLGLLTIPYIWCKTAAGALAQNYLYKPKISALVYMHTFQIYLNPFFYLDHVLRGGSSMVLLGALLLIAAAMRQRYLIFGWFFVSLSVLPFIFIPHYAAFFYLPALGWALIGAGLLILLRNMLVAVIARPELPAGPKSQTIALCILLIPVVSFLAISHSRESRKTFDFFESAQVPLSPLIEGLQSRCVEIREGTTVWFRHDPFPSDSYTLEQAVHLTCSCPNAKVGRGGTAPKGNVIVLSYDGKQLLADENGIRN